MEKVIVTGGAGFIGSHVVELLLQEKYEPIVVDNLHTGKKENIPSKVKLYEVDIVNKEALEKIFQREKPTYVIHLAAQTSIRVSLTDPERDAQTNVIGSLNILECSKKYGVKKIIYSASGGTVYGEVKKLPITEDYPMGIITNHYGVSKYCVEQYLKLYQYLYNLNYTILRLANVYGPRQDPNGEAGVIAIFMGQLMQDKQPLIFGDGEQTRDFIYVKDVAKIIVQSLKSKGKEGIFNVGTGKQTSINYLLKQIVKTMGKRSSPKYEAAIRGELRHSCLDNTKAKKELGWEPTVNMKEGLQETYGWFKDYARKH